MEGWSGWMIVADIVKFYGCELGAQTKYDKKDGTSIVNGAHDTTKLCELLEVGAQPSPLHAGFSLGRSIPREEALHFCKNVAALGL